MQDKLASALDLAERGFAVFPLAPNAKTPVVTNWQNIATTDTERIRKCWTEDPARNIGVPTEGYVVVDVDPRHGGDATFAELTLFEDFPKTARARTQGGGDHIVYALPAGVRVKGGTNLLGPGVDVKSWGGYIVAPGSEIDGRPYAWANDRAVAPAPAWLIERCNAARPRTDSAGKRLVEEDETAIAMATEWVRRQPAVPDGQIDDTEFKIAARCYDFGCGFDTVLELLHEWCTAGNIPTSAERLKVIAASAGRNRDNAIGARHPSASGFEAVAIAERPVSAKAESGARAEKFYWYRADAAAGRALRTPREPLLQNVMNANSEAVLIGKPGGGKTFGLLDWFYHGARGLPWAGNTTKQGAYVYVAAEAQEGVDVRIAALETKYGPLGDTPLFVIPVAPDLAHGKEDVEGLVKSILAIEKECGQKVRIVAVDTLNRAIAGGDESSSKDMGAVINAMRMIRTAVKCASLLVHHPGWTETRSRGHSSIFGAVDTELQLVDGVLEVVKFRDGAAGHKIRIKLSACSIGLDPNGLRVVSCTVSATPAAGTAEAPIPMTDTEEEILSAIDEALEDAQCDTFSAPDVINWVEQYRIKSRGFNQIQPDTQPDTCPTLRLSRPTVSGHLRVLSEKGWIKKHSYGQWVRRKTE